MLKRSELLNSQGKTNQRVQCNMGGAGMWSYRLFWKLFLSYFAISFSSAGLFFWLASQEQDAHVLNMLRDRVKNVAAVLRETTRADMVAGNVEHWQPVLERLSHETDLRLSLISVDGHVWADSHRSPAELDNHKDRPEFIDAMQLGIGESSRTSNSVHQGMQYVALRVEGSNGPVGVVRVSMPLTGVQAQIQAIQRIFYSIGPTLAVVVLVLTYFVVARIIGPVAVLTKAVQAIETGDFECQVTIEQEDEFGALGLAFNRMNRELKSRIDQLRKNGERLATVLGSMAEGVIAVDDRQRILFANDAARNMLGMPAQNLSGRPVWEVVRNRTFGRAVDEAFEEADPVKHEFEFAPTHRMLAIHAKPLPGDPRPGVVLVLHDVTELRRLERLRQEFVANVSHELKTPLSSIKAYTETLLNGALQDSTHNVLFLKRIEEQSERLHTLILDMLHLSHIETGREVFEIVPVSVTEVAHACISGHLGQAENKHIELILEPPLVPLQVRADEEGMRTILDNLVNNAIKYTPEHGKVSVRWYSEADVVHLEVSDTGIGIAPQDQARVFERFYRVDKARSRELGGTGLGLSIVKHLTHSFGGSVSVDSEVGQGAVFTVTLPRVDPTAPHSTALHSTEEMES